MKEKKPLRTILLIFIFALLVSFVLIALNNELVVRRYEIEDERISAPVRIALITDLHSCKYGKNQRELIAAVDAIAPDLVLMSGDIFDDEVPDTNTDLFIAGIANRYPCYYVTGNHEYWGGTEEYEIHMQILEQYGVTTLFDRSEAVTVNGQIINLCGVCDPDVSMIAYDSITELSKYEWAQKNKISTFLQKLDKVSEAAENGYYTILLSHRPELFHSYAALPYDLVLCGHAHGGQWRIPGILNGLYAPNQGLFPEFAGGNYEKNDTTMIVSRGLARESTKVPRIFNRPELVLIEIH